MTAEPFEPPTAEIQKLTKLLAQDPAVWEGMRGNTQQMFDALAPQWETIVGSHHVAPLRAALERVPVPRAALDIGTGTGLGADAVLDRFPDALVCGADIAQEMLRAAAAKPRERPLRLVRADASALPFRDRTLDIVVALNCFVFFSEAARVLAPDGRLVIVYSDGENTPIYLPPDELRSHLERAGLAVTDEGRSERGTFTVARRAAV